MDRTNPNGSGISLGPNKEALVSARIGKRMRALGLAEADEYLRRLGDDTTGGELVHLLDAISTNVTSFFREARHFALLGNLFSEWLQQGQHRFRFWSAAARTRSNTRCAVAVWSLCDASTSP